MSTKPRMSIHDLDEIEKRDSAKGRVTHTRAATFQDVLPRAHGKTDQTADLASRDGPKIVVNQSDHLTAAEAREFAQASLGSFDIQEVGADPFHGVRDMLSLPLIDDVETNQPSPINVAVIGANSWDRKNFVRKALDLPSTGPTLVTERKVPFDGQVHHVRLFELPIQDVSVDDEEAVEWPESIDQRIDGALTLVDVTERATYDNVPGVLSAISKAALPSVLVSTKCDAPVAQRQLDIDAIEKRAKKEIENLGTVQASDTNVEDHRRAMLMVLRAVVSGNPWTRLDKHPSSSAYWVTGMLTADAARTHPSARQRAQSSATRSLSPRQNHHLGHSRASSELTRSSLRMYSQSRHDPSISTRGVHGRMDRPGDQFRDDAQYSFLADDSASDIHSDGDDDAGKRGVYSAASSSLEHGVTFEFLVDRLLSRPTSKADSKISVIFLALYREFAAPGRLLETLIQRFDALERNDGRPMIRTVEQMRHLSILEQWIGSYPGDFAYPQTKQRMRNFISRISQVRIFAIAAKEMGTHLDMVREDDDTIWKYTDRDRDRELERTAARSAWPSKTQIEVRNEFLEGGRDFGPYGPGESDLTQSPNSLGPAPSSFLISVETAQKQALLFQPTQRQTLSKVHWRALMDVPEQLLARELTRIDWTLFTAVRPRDMVRHVSLKKDEAEKYKNLAYVAMMTDHFNHIATWVSNFVLLRDKPKHRVLMLIKFMRVARRLRELNNYNSLGAIIAGVKSTPVYRLAATRDLLSPSVSKDWMKLEILMSPTKSHFAYRLAWENTSGERIPYLPLHRRDLVSAEEGNRTFIGDRADEWINWKKFEIMGEVIVGLQRAQGMPFQGLADSRPDAAIRELILDVKLQKDEDILYERSLQCEPAGSNSGPSHKIKEFFKR